MYNYKEQVKNDCIDAIREYINYHKDDIKGMSRDDLQDKLYDTFWIDDSVTGNASGSYTFNAWEAHENLNGNMDLLAEAMSEFGCNVNVLEKGSEWCDVTIRCYLLCECLNNAMEEIKEEIENALEKTENQD